MVFWLSKISVGFDIGASAVKIAVCAGGKPVRTVVEELPENLVKGGVIVSEEAMGQTLCEVVRKHRVRKGGAAVILPDSQVFLRRLTMPAMTTDQLSINLPYEFRDFITQEKDKYFYDYSVCSMREDGSTGKPAEMDLMAAATLKETIEGYTAMFRRAGFKLNAAAPRECAYSNIIRAYERVNAVQPGEEYAILDLGHAETRVHIFTGPNFEATRVIDQGCGVIDRAIAEENSIDTHIARAYKENNHNDVLNGETPHRVYGNIAIEIMKAINFYGFNNPNSKLSRLYVCGGGASIQPLVEAIAQAVRLELHPVEDLLPAGAENAAVCAGAIGAAMG